MGMMNFWQRPPSVVYWLWRYLPGRVQCLLLRLGAEKVTVGAAAVITDRHGRILVAHHTYRSGRPWALPGGLIGSREDPQAGMARELREELGLEAAVGPVLFAETDPVSRHLTLFYRAKIGGAPRPDGVEVDAFRFVSLEELAGLTGEPAPAWLRAALGRGAAVA